MREAIKANRLKIVSEDFTDYRELKKKMLFKQPKYGKILALVLEKLHTKIFLESLELATVHTWMDFLNQDFESIKASVNPDDFSSEEDFFDACYDKLLAATSLK